MVQSGEATNERTGQLCAESTGNEINALETVLLIGIVELIVTIGTLLWWLGTI
jgi:hypothetical protein